MKTISYIGKLLDKKLANNTKELFLSTIDKPFVEVLTKQFGGKFVNVEYWITNKEVTKSEADMLYLKHLTGKADVNSEDYCDNAGMGGIFFQAGKTTDMGSLLVDILEMNLGKYIILEFN